MIFPSKLFSTSWQWTDERFCSCVDSFMSCQFFISGERFAAVGMKALEWTLAWKLFMSTFDNQDDITISDEKHSSSFDQFYLHVCILTCPLNWPLLLKLALHWSHLYFFCLLFLAATCSSCTALYCIRWLIWYTGGRDSPIEGGGHIMYCSPLMIERGAGWGDGGVGWMYELWCGLRMSDELSCSLFITFFSLFNFSLNWLECGLWILLVCSLSCSLFTVPTSPSLALSLSQGLNKSSCILLTCLSISHFFCLITITTITRLSVWAPSLHSITSVLSSHWLFNWQAQPTIANINPPLSAFTLTPQYNWFYMRDAECLWGVNRLVLPSNW